MTEVERLLEARKKAKSRKPDFLYQDHYRRKELPKRWRRPRGLHSKIRMRVKGHIKRVEPGYSSPVLVRGLDRHGLRPVVVSNVDELKGLDASRDVAVIRHGVGVRKALLIGQAASERGVKVSNPADKKAARIGSAKAARARVRESDKARAPVKGETKETKDVAKPEPVISGEVDKKEADKQEKDRVLTKRSAR
ncbi:50S ribosomal protein L32e [Candidatus Woesearchaeota archaeon]|nr:50S ribosomal protein L32e [Candidatus Woesearchaeota archaeon]